MTENVLFVRNEISETNQFDSSGHPDIRPYNFRVLVPTGKWLTSDPDVEDSNLMFNKDYALAFEFPDYDHAKRAVDLISILLNADAVILGEMREHG